MKTENLIIEDITLKIQSLSNNDKKEVLDFIEFLLNKKKSKKKTNLRKKLLQVSVWNKTDLKAIEKATDNLNQWKIKEF
ncbi:MAG: DUF2281 domain-containing protein [Nitrospirae bacterium]|nr:DUF2281 domain-containing protein [Nitrospirota bacterium]